MLKHLLPTALCLALAVPAYAADKTLVVGASVFPESLQTGPSQYNSLSLIEQTNDPLIARDDAGNLVPALATSWEQMGDSLWRFHLRQGVKFHDGVEFTSEDVVFTIDRVLDPKSGYGMLGRIGLVTGAKAIDTYTVDITTKGIFPTVLRGLSDIVMEPEHYYKQAGAQAVARHPIGTGPFVFSKWVSGDRYELTANKDHWGGAPKFDRLVIRQISEGSTRVASLVAGETQIIEEVPIDLIGEVEAAGTAKVDEITTSVGLILTYDVRKPPFDNPRVREAFDYAIDKPTILKEILKGHGELLQGQLLTASTFGFNPDLKPRPFDPALAKKMLTDAGFDFKTPVPITTQSGKYVSDVDMCNAVAGMLFDIGVKATVNVVEGGVYSKLVAANTLGPLSMIGWYSLGDADFATIWFTRLGKRSVWFNDEYERLFADARSTTDDARRTGDYHRMMQIMHDQDPAMFLFGLPSLYGVGTAITGFHAASDKVLRLSKVEMK